MQREIVELIKKNDLDIHFLNVKSHTGIVGNSVADRIAKDISNHLNKLDLLRDLSFWTRKLIGLNEFYKEGNSYEYYSTCKIYPVTG